MPTPELFLDAAKWMAIGTVGLAAIAALAFLLKWGIRFRLVGITGFCVVLTVGLFGLGFEPLTPTVVTGSIPYTTVYDSGSAQIVIKVPNTITDSQLEATLQQAAKNLLRSSRLSNVGQIPTIRARTIRHQDPGISELLYLGQIQPNRTDANDQPWSIQLNQKNLAAAHALAASSS